MRRLLTFTLLFISVTAARAEDREAAQLFRKMDDKVRSAKALRIVYDSSGPMGTGGTSATGSVLLADGNKLRWEETSKGGAFAGTTLLIADGKSLAMSGL